MNTTLEGTRGEANQEPVGGCECLSRDKCFTWLQYQACCSEKEHAATTCHGESDLPNSMGKTLLSPKAVKELDPL